MAVGQQSTYDFTAGIPINMDEAIYQYSPVDSPFLTGRDADGRLILPSLPVDEINYKWMDEEILTPRSQLAVNLTATDTDNVITVTTGHRNRFSTGDQVTIQGTDELIRIDGYGSTADTLTCTRAYQSTTVAAAATNDTVIIVGRALTEGSAAENARSVDRVERDNYTGIFIDKVEITRTESQRRKFGVRSELAHQTNKTMLEQVLKREYSVLYGFKFQDTANKVRGSAGLFRHITTNEDSVSTQLTIATVQAQQQTCFNEGGVPNVLVANPAALSDLNAITDTDRVRQTVVDTLRGRMPVMVVYTEHGPVTVVRNRWVLDGDAALYQNGQFIRRVFSPTQLVPLGRTRDGFEYHIVTEEGWQFKGERHAAKFTGLTYTS